MYISFYLSDILVLLSFQISNGLASNHSSFLLFKKGLNKLFLDDRTSLNSTLKNLLIFTY